MIGQFTKVCREDEIDEGKVKTFHISGHDILLAKYQGKIYALENLCTHDGGELGEGTLIEDQVMCPRHGARFDIKTGDVKAMPAAVGIGTYDLKTENGEVFVDLKE